MFTKEEKIIGLASLATLGLLMLRKKPDAVATTEGGALDGWSPPDGTPEDVYVVGDLGGAALFNDEAICQQWKSGNNRLPWGTIQWAKVKKAVDMGLDAHAVKNPANMFIARELNFRVVRHAIGLLCPQLDLPTTKDGLELIYPKSPMWFKDLWSRVNTVSWDKFTALMGSDV